MIVIAICMGASLGALLRWQLGRKLNYMLPVLPLGTLSANMIGTFAFTYFLKGLKFLLKCVY